MTSDTRSMMKRILLATTMALGLGLAAPSVGHAGYRVFVKVDGIEGDSLDRSYPRQIEALSFAWGVSQADAGGTSTGTLATRATFTGFNITKSLDRASVPLAMSAAAGDHFKAMVVTVVRDTAAGPQPMAVFTLSNVMVSSVSMAGAAGASLGTPVEDVSFAFTRIDATYYVYDQTGRATGTVSRGWDLVANKRA